jgi:hypothetical protein
MSTREKSSCDADAGTAYDRPVSGSGDVRMDPSADEVVRDTFVRATCVVEGVRP